MKKSILVVLFALAALGLVSAATTGGAIVTGTVAEQLSVAITGASSGNNTTFEIVQTGETARSLGSVKVISNYKSWYIRVSSGNTGNLGKLVNTDGETIDYQFTMGSLVGLQAVELDATAESHMTAKTAKLGDTYTMAIAYGDSGTSFYSKDGGNFTDTITITVAAN
ncbi:MAG: hypothetical protein WAZ99_03570 [Rectinemataceae bacterium]